MTKDSKRRAILDAAMDLFGRFGVARTSVVDIARQLGMSSANIYNFFPSRDAIIEAVGDFNLASLKQRILAETERETDPWARIRILFLSTATHLRVHLLNEKDVLHLQLLEHRHQWQFVIHFHQFLRDTAEATIGEAISRGLFRAMDPKTATLALFDCMIASFDALLLVRLDRADLEHRLTAQLDLLEFAFRTPSPA